MRLCASCHGSGIAQRRLPPRDQTDPLSARMHNPWVTLTYYRDGEVFEFDAPISGQTDPRRGMAHPEIQPDELRARLNAGESIFILDVREPAEVAEWAFPGAVNIPLGQLGDRTDELPTDRPIVVTCHMGGRSATATQALVKAGWRAENLVGGALGWVTSEPDA